MRENAGNAAGCTAVLKIVQYMCILQYTLDRRCWLVNRLQSRQVYLCALHEPLQGTQFEIVFGKVIIVFIIVQCALPWYVTVENKSFQ